MVFNTVIKQTKYFANQLQHKKDKSIIPAILDPTRNINQNPQIINNIFQNFYSNLYSPTHQPTQSEIDTFLNSLTLPKLTAEQANILDAPLSPNELTKARKFLATSLPDQMDYQPNSTNTFGTY